MFLFMKINVSTFAAVRRDLFLLRMFPARLNTRSDDIEEAGIASICLAIIASRAKKIHYPSTIQELSHH